MITTNPKILISQYNELVRCLLGVRKNTAINVCLVDSGISTVQFVISRKRKISLKSKLQDQNLEEPFHFVYELYKRENTPGFRFMDKALQLDSTKNPLETIMDLIRNKLDTVTQCVAYWTKINPDLMVHDIYSRLRLMSHNLRIDTRREFRTLVELRVCQCGEDNIQDENHVTVECTLSHNYRQWFERLNFSSLSDLLNEKDNYGEVCKYIGEVVKLYT